LIVVVVVVVVVDNCFDFNVYNATYNTFQASFFSSCIKANPMTRIVDPRQQVYGIYESPP